MLARLRNGFYLAPGLLALLGCLPAQAQEAYPSRAITLIVPYETGGSIDAAARVIQPALEKQLGQKVIIENRGGGVGIIGTELGINAEPDGYTLMNRPGFVGGCLV